MAAAGAVAAATVGAPSLDPRMSGGTAAAQPAEATVVVSPAEGLTDGQTVQVTATGLAPDAFARQCAAAPQDLADCDLGHGTLLEPGTGGSLIGERRVFAVIHTERRGTVDCRIVGSCVVVATPLSAEDPLAGSPATPVAFDPVAPLLPAPTITVTPSADLDDGQVVRIDGRDLRHRDLVQVQFLQCGPEPSFATCRSLIDPELEPPESDPTGSITYDTNVWQVIDTDHGAIDCRVPAGAPPCVLVATTRPWATVDPPWATRAPITFDAGATPAPTPTLEVTPSADLGDVTDLTVRGRDFTPGAPVRVGVCDLATPVRCDSDTWEQPTADAGGAFELQMRAFATFETFGPAGERVECRATSCHVAAEDLASLQQATAPVSFGPPGAPRGRYLDPVFDDVDVVEEIVYRRTLDYRGNEVDLRLDVYRPAGDTATSRPAIVWIHGGWFTGGDGGGDMAHLATAMAQRGYVAIDIGYRVRPDMATDDWPQLYEAMLDAYEDATAAVEWVRTHADEYGIDPDVIMAGGFSAGAVTTTNLAYLPGQIGPDTSGIAAAIPLEGWFVRPDEPGLPQLGPVAIPDPGEPPALVLHGTADQLLPWGSPTDTCPMAEEAGITCEYVPYEGMTHGRVYGRVREVAHRSTRFIVDEALTPRGYFDVAADAGGPYEVVEGSALALAGSGTGDELDHAWSPSERLDDPAAPDPTYTAHDDGSEELTLTVTNAHGIAAGDSAEITTLNAAPAIGDVATVLTGDHGVAVTAPLTDAGLADTHTAEVDWGDGTVEPLAVVQAAGTAVATGAHDYARPGRYDVTIRVADDDAGTDTWTDAVTVGCTIEGTEGSDLLIGTSGDDVICALGGTDVVLAGGGDDTVLAGDGADVVLAGRGGDVIDGGPGSDLVLAGRGDDSVDGGDGDDWLRGDRGDDVLRGGPGQDRADGGRGRDECGVEIARRCETTG